MTVSDFLSGWVEADGNSFDNVPDLGDAADKFPSVEAAAGDLPENSFDDVPDLDDTSGDGMTVSDFLSGWTDNVPAAGDAADKFIEKLMRQWRSLVIESHPTRDHHGDIWGVYISIEQLYNRGFKGAMSGRTFLDLLSASEGKSASFGCRMELANNSQHEPFQLNGRDCSDVTFQFSSGTDAAIFHVPHPDDDLISLSSRNDQMQSSLVPDASCDATDASSMALMHHPSRLLHQEPESLTVKGYRGFWGAIRSFFGF